MMFDVYHEWLGIPPEGQPPNHYQLLGLTEFESAHSVINNAADQRMTHLRQFQNGPNAAASQELLNEISRARICLLDDSAKKAYDAQLRDASDTQSFDNQVRLPNTINTGGVTQSKSLSGIPIIAVGAFAAFAIALLIMGLSPGTGWFHRQTVDPPDRPTVVNKSKKKNDSLPKKQKRDQLSPPKPQGKRLLESTTSKSEDDKPMSSPQPVVAKKASVTAPDKNQVAVASEPDNGKLIELNANGVTVNGELGRENKTHIEVLDIETGKNQIFEKSKVQDINRNLSEAEVIDRCGVAKLVAWKISKFTSDSVPTGKIAKIEGSRVFVALWANSSLAPKHKLRVQRLGGPIKDPSTGRVLGQDKKTIGGLTVVSVSDGFAVAVTQGVAAERLRVGDEVVPLVASNSIAILPLVSLKGFETEGGKKLSQELTKALAMYGLPVVERTLLSSALAKLSMEPARLLDEKSARECGEQVGAFAVLTGTIAQPENGKTTCRLRLIEVATGQILVSITHKLDVATYQSTITVSSTSNIAKAREFLSRVVDRRVGLVPTYKGSDRFLLHSDNYIAEKILASSHPASANAWPRHSRDTTSPCRI